MNASALLPELVNLPQSDKLWLIGELLQTLPAQPALPVTDEELEVLDERIKQADDQPESLLDSSEFRQRLHEKLGWAR